MQSFYFDKSKTRFLCFCFNRPALPNYGARPIGVRLCNVAIKSTTLNGRVKTAATTTASRGQRSLGQQIAAHAPCTASADAAFPGILEAVTAEADTISSVYSYRCVLSYIVYIIYMRINIYCVLSLLSRIIVVYHLFVPGTRDVMDK